MASPDVRDAITARYEQRMADLARSYTSGAIDLSDFQITMRQELRDAYALQLRAGNDGPITDTNAYLKLGNELKSQYGYLEQFSRDIRNGSQAPDGIAARTRLYAQSARQMYWRQSTEGAGLPAYPGDGTSQCKTNCGCSWDLQDDGYHWVRSKDDSCETCIERESTWNPYHAV